MADPSAPFVESDEGEGISSLDMRLNMKAPHDMINKAAAKYSSTGQGFSLTVCPERKEDKQAFKFESRKN